MEQEDGEDQMTAMLNELLASIDKMEEESDLIKMQENSLQNDVNYDKVLSMNEQEINKLSLLKRLVNWLVPDVQENASTEVEVTENTQEEEMDIAILKEALGAVVDEKLDTFATSIKEEIEASVQEKIDTITKGFEANTVELQEKLEAAEKALLETEEQVSKFANAGAIKKSVDPEEEDEDETITKSDSIWENVYLPQGVINALGYKS
jgi:LPS O-antigen subunit length determinant protein (WzzB/FepE family)